MSCEHEVRFTIKPTDDACRFHFDVRAYKDRIVAPDEYSGVTVVTPSHIEQVLLFRLRRMFRLKVITVIVIAGHLRLQYSYII